VLRQLLKDHLDVRAAREEPVPGSTAPPQWGRTGSRGPGWRPATAGSCGRLDLDLVALQKVIRTPERDQLGELLADTNLQATHQAARLCCRPA